jgi:stage V sporulation protein B
MKNILRWVMRKKDIIAGTLILTFATSVIRVVGFIFRIYLANTLGSEGMGLYQLILSIYFLMITLATSGIRTAVSRLISEELSLSRYSNAKKVLRQSVGLSLLTGFGAAAAMYYFADYLGRVILNDERTVLSIMYLAPSLPALAVSSCYKGYFYGVGRVAKPSFIQIAEQLVRIFVIFNIMNFFLPKGIEYGCAAVAIGMTVEELFSLGLTWLFYISDKKPFASKLKQKPDNMIFKILAIVLPLSGTSYINSALRAAENTLIPARLMLYGATAGTALSLYGIVKGMVLPLLFFPSSFLTSLSSILIPSVAGDNAASNEKRVTETLSIVMHYTAVSGIFVVSIFLAFPDEIAMAVYNDSQVGTLLKIISYVCPFMYMNMVISSMLNALGEQMSSFRINIVESILKISIIYFFIPLFGFDAYLFALFLTTVLNTVSYTARLLKVSCILFDISNWIFKPICAAAFSTFTSKYLYGLFLERSSNNIAALVSSLLILALLYFMGLIATGSIRLLSYKELKRLVLVK